MNMNFDRLKFRVWNEDKNRFNSDLDKDWIDAVSFDGDIYDINPATNDCGLSGFNNKVIEQCTGLKDKNGKLIFEGDIIKKPYNDFYEYSIHVISWEDGAYTTKRCLYMKDKKSGELIDCSNGGFCFTSHITQKLADSFEVIGNIHENPELMK